MNLNFYLQSFIVPGGDVRVREHFEFVGGGQRIDVNGHVVPAIWLEGHVDEDIKREHSKEYVAFTALVEKHKDAAYAAAKASPGKRIYTADFVPVVEAAPELLSEVPAEDLEDDGKNRKGKKKHEA